MKENNGHCVVLYDYLVDSKAWSGLSGSAVKIYIQLVRKRYIKFEGKGKRKYIVDDNIKRLILTQADAKKLWKMDRRTLTSGMRELIDRGFVDLIQHGFLLLDETSIGIKQPNIYGLSERWRDYGTDRFKKGEYVESPRKGRKRDKTV